ncbi:MAG: exo-beta-N-acetylmuramidase NamZ family protein [Cyclobacteriaceae bacterium]
MIRVLIFSLLITLLCSDCRSANLSDPNTEKVSVLACGADQMDVILKKTAGKKVGVFVNHTAVLGSKTNGTHLVDTLKKAGVNLVRIFSPEHGFRGDADAGEDVGNSIDPKSGVPIVSLYGPNKKPKPEALVDLDIVLFDMQDVGVRFFTYISSLHYLMEACAEQGKKVIILDRPNPNGEMIDGPVLEKEFKSFVGMHPIPVAHGMTLGEYAQMINGEGWLPGGKKCELEVITMKNWNRQEPYSVPNKPSPNLPNDHAIKMYPSTCFFEGTVLSIGRGTYHPFEVAGHPDLKGMYAYSFKPVSIPGMSKTPPLEGQECYGLDMREEPVPHQVELRYLIEAYQKFPNKEKFFIPYFEKLAGTAELRKQIISGLTAEQIRETWKPGLEAFKLMRKKYLLYP